jgi:hypothetical protein
VRFLWEGNREAPWHSVVEEFTRFGIGYPLGINAATTPDSLEPTLDVRAMAADLWRVRAELAHLRREAENVRYLEGWLRTNYSRRLGACDSLPDAHLWLESERSRERFCDAPTLAALGHALPGDTIELEG